MKIKNNKNLKKAMLDKSMTIRFFTGLIISIFAFQALAQFGLKKYTINSAGGQMSSVTYTLNGSIGQVDANDTQTGGNYTLKAGFWHGSVSAPLTETIFSNGFE